MRSRLDISLSILIFVTIGLSGACRESNPTYNPQKGPPGLDSGASTDLKVLPKDHSTPPPNKDGALPKKDKGTSKLDKGIPKKDKAAPPPDLPKLPPDKAVPTCVGMTCPLGCNQPQNRCYRLKPANYDVKASYQQATAGLSVNGQGSIDTTNGQIKVGSKVIRPANKVGLVNGIYWQRKAQAKGYPGLSIFVVKSLAVDKGATLKVTGADALAVYATGNIKVEGTIHASGSGQYAGAGGGAGGKSNGADGAPCNKGHGLGGDQGGSGSNQVEAGGGGGGRIAKGGKGGDSSYFSKPKGGAGGAANNVKTLTPLYGGCGGGAGGGPDTGGVSGGTGGYGAGGGGAIQLSANGALTISGIITAPGGGGEGGHGGGGGGGGGSGGAILLEGITLTHAGYMAANGGGGGSGSGSASFANSYNGTSGRYDGLQAGGGANHGPYGGAGGKGGSQANSGGSNGSANANGGGGGGAAGMIRLNTHTSPVISGKVSPGHTSGKIAVW